MASQMKEAESTDADVISKLATETFFETYAWYNSPENMLSYIQTNFNPEQTKKEICEADTKFFLIFEKDEPAGYAKLRVSETPDELAGEKHIEIERVYVLKKFQKQKLGVKLIEKCIGYSKENKYEVIWLGVWEQNHHAINFYTRSGFEKFGEHVFTLGNDLQKDYLMKLQLQLK